MSMPLTIEYAFPSKGDAGSGRSRRWPQTFGSLHEKEPVMNQFNVVTEARFLGLFAARKLAHSCEGGASSLISRILTSSTLKCISGALA